jgi:hypothetical protein
MVGARLTQPEMLSPWQFLAVAIECGILTLRRRSRQKKLSFAHETKGYGTGWISAFPKHGGGVPIISFKKLGQRVS